MPKENVAKEFLSNLGLSEMKLPDNDSICTLSGEESALYDIASENDIDSAENRKLFDFDNSSYSRGGELKFRKKLYKPTLTPSDYCEV